MGSEETIYEWHEVMGNNMIYPTVRMLYKPTILLRKTRLKSEGRYGTTRFLRVSHDKSFVVWRLKNVLREFELADEPKLREVFEEILKSLE